MSRCTLNEIETRHHLISIRLYLILTILITEDGPQPSFFNDCNFSSAVRRSKPQILIFLLITYYKMKTKKVPTVGTVPKCIRNIVEIVTFEIPITHIHDRSLSWFSTGSSIKSDKVKLVFSYR